MQRHSRIWIGLLIATGSLLWTAARTSHASDPPDSPAVSWSNLPYNQGWTPEARDKFYYTSQGSEMMPYYWFLAIERAGSQTLFRENLERFGFLIPPPSPKSQEKNPDMLPLGFVADPSAVVINGIDESKWVGLTCAACHTGAIDYKKPGDTKLSTFVVDGGPTLANFGAFIQELAAAIAETQDSPEKYARFEQRLLVNNPSPDARAKVKRNFTQFAAEFKLYLESSKTDVPWGRGRVDAFGMIFNKVCFLALKIQANNTPPNAPVSYPFLWNVNRQDHIQWHGDVENKSNIPFITPLDRLGRNAGEVMGVFARIDMTPGHGLGYPSSVKLGGLTTLEYEMEKLSPPKWPADLFGKVTDADKRAGADLYKQYCENCHVRITSSFQTVHIKLPKNADPLKGGGITALKYIKTDPNMTVNVHTRLNMQTGWLLGKTVTIFPNDRFKATASASALVSNAVIGALLHLPLASADKAVLPSASKEQVAVSYKPTVQPKEFDPAQIGYESRPLHGIWATAPYLHNGSVPNLWELLLPAKDRSPVFYVGSREFDSQKVGFKSDVDSGGELFDTHLDGNHNTGHEYGVDLNEEQRRQLIEYLKTL